MSTSTQVAITELEIMANALVHHDWEYENSDDHKQYKRGKTWKGIILQGFQRHFHMSKEQAKLQYEDLYENRDDVIWALQSVQMKIRQLKKEAPTTKTNKEAEMKKIKMQYKGEVRQLKVSDLAEQDRERVIRVEDLRKRVRPEAVWPEIVYRGLLIKSEYSKSEKQITHRFNWDREVWDEISFKHQRGWLEQLAAKMQEKGYQTSLIKATLTCWKEA